MDHFNLYNSLSKKKEIFEPITPGIVKMYVCGPTVYDLLHVGNFRGLIFFNVLRNWLKHLGYSVNYVYNYTDIDDKIIKKSKEENKLALHRAFINGEILLSTSIVISGTMPPPPFTFLLFFKV